MYIQLPWPKCVISNLSKIVKPTWWAEPAPATSTVPPVNHRAHLAMALTAKSFVYDVLTNQRHTRWIAPLLILGDALLCALVIWKIACKIASRCRVLNQTQLTKQ